MKKESRIINLVICSIILSTSVFIAHIITIATGMAGENLIINFISIVVIGVVITLLVYDTLNKIIEKK
jgi:hypothetical protein